ncbi:MAG: hypothetical protein IJE16_05725 [Ruminococcus sp.]|nr:hypothetical protein [Ruminococcus sp.]
MRRLSAIICLILTFVLVATMLSGCKTKVDEEYQYNNVIETNDKKPVDGEPEIEAISGYVEDAQQKLLSLPCKVKDLEIEIVSIGKYTGLYTENDKQEEVEDVFALIVKNPTDQLVSYSTFTAQCGNELFATFSPTNIPAHQSALVLTTNAPVAYADVKEFKITDSMAVMSDSLPMLDGIVGVDFKDGQFIVTNLTGDELGDVYIRYKACTDGNAYLGGITYSAMVSDVQPYETYTVDAPLYSEESGVIIAVENLK